MSLSARRRFALWLGEKLRALAFWLDVHTARRYDPETKLDLTDEEWADFEEAMKR